MNRLILVGNGFDLAHGLKTSYKDFIDDFWKSSFEEIVRESNIGKVNLNNGIIEVSNENYINIPRFINKPEIKNYSDFTRELENYFFKHEIINKFFENINDKFNFSNWVDIENEYYQELKIVDDLNIEQLNQNFEIVKKQLENYLSKIKKDFIINSQISQLILSSIYLKDLESLTKNIFIEKIFNECKIENDKLIYYLKNFKKEVLRYKESSPQSRDNYFNKEFDKYDTEYKRIFKEIIFPKNTLLLNFNYTNTTLEYIDEFNKINGNYEDYNISEIHIHGELNNPENPIIFGFGDDVDKKYQEFEDLNDNRYLENFKSIAYLQTDNYKKLLEFIDSEEYQVFIFGHSCGISDRTMLNTIFEHDNCKSIKPFYHRKKDDKGNYIVDDFGNFIDNYTEIVQNISRNFNDKKKYRDRVVNKTYCEPLT